MGDDAERWTIIHLAYCDILRSRSATITLVIMVRERGQKKSYQHSLEDIKEKMREKRSKRLQSASMASRGLSKNKGKINISGCSKPLLLKSVQENNRALAHALEEEKAKFRQAQGLILQLKREQQTLLLHLLLLKRKLQQQESQPLPQELAAVDLNRAGPITSSPVRMHSTCDQEPFRADPCIEEPSDTLDEAPLPRTVTARRRRESRRSPSHKRGRRSSWQESDPAFQGTQACEGEEPSRERRAIDDHVTAEEQGEPEVLDLNSEVLAPDLSPTHQSTPEAPPPSKRPRPPQQQQQQKKPVIARAKPSERGRKPDRPPLKKPWENAKQTRGRSQSRERRPKGKPQRPAPSSATPGDRLNATLGSNDTFDFDCEEAVHLTPFRTGGRGAEEKEPDRVTPTRGGDSPVGRASPSSSESCSSQDEDDSPYLPYRKPRGRARDVARVETPVIRAEDRVVSLRLHPEGTQQSPVRWSNLAMNSRSRSSWKLVLPNPRSPKAGHTSTTDKENLLPGKAQPGNDRVVSPPLEAESDVMMAMADPTPLMPRVWSDGGQSRRLIGGLSPVTCLTPAKENKPRPPVTTETKRRRGALWALPGRRSGPCDITNLSSTAFRKFSVGRPRVSASSCGDSTPAPARARRCTIAVDYKEPTLNAKLRRGDKFTDTKFLRSPIFKQKRRSVKTSKTLTLSKYNESFVGCR
ncbi:hypothetical protein GJAV_G00105960 [Gymnothorax javanicus]|nr:hypothetical protein GJAV_G00105960 [Gymnothorax javanicus]